MSNKLLVFYAGMLYSEHVSYIDTTTADLPNGSYIRDQYGRWFVIDYTAVIIEEEDVPPQVRMLALLLS